MRRIGLTQRVEIVPEYEERRDCLDQSWATLLCPLGLMPIPLMNLVEDVAAYVDTLGLDGVILTGGNDVSTLEDAANPSPDRDRFEHKLLDILAERKLPVIGVCRGMQLLALHHGSRLAKVPGHVARRHPISVETDCVSALQETKAVNSYHNSGIRRGQLGSPLRAMAYAEDGSIEAVAHVALPHYGIMWHPEREKPHQPTDLALLRWVFGDTPS